MAISRQPWHPATLPLLVLLLTPLVAGCLDGTQRNGPAGTDSPTPDDGDGTRERLWTNPYDFTIHFDGWTAYDLVLAQLYADPANTTGPRYRIPGTADHAAVSAELLAHLDDAVKGSGGRASASRFDGDTYYALDLTPVQAFLGNCPEEARDRVRDLQFVNIVGRTDPERIGYIIGAHWDSKRHATGSDDPILGGDDSAASTAAVIELARAFAAEPVDLPLTFVLFDGEDGFDRDDCHPLAGSLHYAQNLSPTEQDTVEGMILLDMVGNASAKFYWEANSRRYTAPTGIVSGTPLLEHVWATAADMEVAAFVERNTGEVIDDHVPFLYEGIRSIDIIRYENGFAPYWHTTRDDHTAVQPEGIDQVGAVVEASLRRWAAEA